MWTIKNVTTRDKSGNGDGPEDYDEDEDGNRVNVSHKLSNPRIYVFPTGETIIDNLERRCNRPADEWLALILPVIHEKWPELNVRYITWNQHAGCTCPCSPGFIVDGAYTFPHDIFIDVEYKPDEK